MSGDNRAFDILVDQMDKLSDYIQDIHQRLSRLEGTILTVVALVSSGGIISLIIYLIEHLE